VLCVAQALAPILALNTLEAWRAAEYRYSIEAQPGVSPPVAIDTLEIGLPPGNPHYFRFASEDLDAIFFAPFFQVGLVIFLPVLLLGTGCPRSSLRRHGRANRYAQHPAGSCFGTRWDRARAASPSATGASRGSD
jgi:hypothetical protein